MKRFMLPLAIFVVLVGFLAVGLRLNPREVPSPLVGKPTPQFMLPRLDDPQQFFSPREMLGQVWLLNVWASWCSACREEHSVLLALAKSDVVPLYGMDYKDVREDAITWLGQGGGDPYRATVMDVDGRVGIDYGVYGVPETYLIDQAGIIRYKHTGPVTETVLREKMIPMINGLLAK